MKAEIVSVGTELMLGRTVNTDAVFLAKELAGLGVELGCVTCVGDDKGRLSSVLRESIERSDIVFTTGGLGPTLDDLTKQTLAEVTGRPLQKDEESWDRLKEYFGSRPLSDNQSQQALLPQGAVALKNTVGTAPGCCLETDGGHIVMMFPGPPRELQPMFLNEALPLLRQHIGAAAIVTHDVMTFNQSEGMAAQKLGALCEQTNPSVATYIGVHNQMAVRVTARAATEAEAAALADPAVEQVKEILGDVVYGVDVGNLEQVVVQMLAERGEEIATAESCTGGLLAKRITDVPGSSAVFRTGVVTYANEAKARLLGVPEELIALKGAVSREVCEAMATGIREESGADYGIGITGIAGPGGGTPEKPVGLVWIGLATSAGVVSVCLQPQGRYPGRAAVRHRSAGMALDMVRRHLLGLPIG